MPNKNTETQMTHFEFNTDQSLWENYRKAYPNAKLQVSNDGHIFCLSGGSVDHGALARFNGRIKAMTTLTQAGWKFKTIPVLCAN